MSEIVENENDRRKPKSKMPQFISALVSKVRSSPSSKLVVDATPVNTNNNSSDIVTPLSSSSDLTPIDPWQTNAQTPTSPISNQMPIMISPNPNHLIPFNTINAMSNSVTVNNVETQNNFNFSQINGLHIGSVYHVAKKVSPKRERTESTNEQINDVTSNEFKKTKTIVGKYFVLLFLLLFYFFLFFLNSSNIMGFFLFPELMQSNEIVDTKTLKIVSEHMTKEWRTFLRILEFSDGEIDQTYERFIAVGPKETIYRLLLNWSRNDYDATVGKLCRLLWKNQQQQCVLKLRDDRKKFLKIDNHSDSNGTGEEIRNE